MSSSSAIVGGRRHHHSASSKFGLVGSFAGDADKLAAIHRMRQRLLRGATTAGVTTEEVRALLSSLPFAGRVEFCAKCLISATEMTAAVQQQNGVLVVQLFRECFDAIVPAAAAAASSKAAREPIKGRVGVDAGLAQQEDDEFVIVSLCSEASAADAPAPASGPLYLRSSHYYVLHVLVATLQSFAPVVVQLFDEYTGRTTSTVFRSSFVRAMVALPVATFSDERLERVYLSSVEAMRRAIVAECKLRHGLRAAFLTRLIDSCATSAAKELIHHATPEALGSQLLRSVQVADEPTANGKILTIVNPEWRWDLNWPLHKDVYLRFLARNLEAHKADPVWCGRFLGEFTSQLQSRLPAPVAMALLGFYQTYRPLSIQSQVPQGVKEYLLALSKKGDLGASSTGAKSEAAVESEIEYAGLERALPNALILRCAAAEDRWSTLKSMLICTPDGLAFSPASVELCKTLLAKLAKKAPWHQPITQLTVELLAALSAREFFRMIIKNVALDSSSSDPSAAGTIRVFLSASFAVPHLRFSKPVLKAWLQLHLDHPTSEALTLKEFANSSEEKLWSDWRKSVCEIFQRRLTVVAGKAGNVLNSTSVRVVRTPITSYVGYTAILAEELFVAFERSQSHLPPTELLTAIIPVIDLLSPLLEEAALAPLYPPVDATKETASAPGVAALAAVRSVGERFIQLAMTVLRRALTFDIQSKQYGRITSQQIQSLLTCLGFPVNLARFPSSAPALFDFYCGVLEAAKIPHAIQQVGFVMVPPTAEECAAGKKKITWVHINASHHAQSTQMCMDALFGLCSAAKTNPALEAIAHKAWPIVRSRYLPPTTAASGAAALDAESLKRITVFNGFLAACSKLPASLVAEEKPLLLAALVHHLKENTLQSAASGTTLDGWWSFLLSAVDGCGAQWPSLNIWLLKFADLSSPMVRQAYEQATFDRDPQIRLQAYLQLLRVSSGTSWQEFAASVDFIQRRTKNEAGLFRRDMYQLIAGNMRTVVSQSLASAAGSAGEQATLASVTLLADAVVQIMKDDVSKRDSVAKGAFHGMGRMLVDHAVSTVAPSLLAIRRAWINCGMTLDWMLLRIDGGEDACHRYVWPIENSTFTLQQSITEAALAGPVQAAMAGGLKGGENAYAELRKQVYSQNRHVHVAAQALYTPAQAVELLASSMVAMRQKADDKVTVGGKSAPRPCDFLVDGALFPAAAEEGNAAGAAAAETNSALALKYESGTLQCVQRLIRFCGVRWVDVPSLVRFFDTVVASVASPPARPQRLAAHCYQTYALFKTVCQLYSSGSAWYELPSLTRACAVLFESAVRRSAVSDAQELRPVWSELKLHQGKIATLGSLALGELGFLVASVRPPQGRQALPANGLPFAAALSHSPAASPLSKSERLLVDKADTTERAATILRDLLLLSPSALHVVWSELVGSRDDIFSAYLGRTREELFGLFDPSATVNMTPLPAKVGAETVWFPITSAQLVSMNAQAMGTFTRICMDRATNQSLGASIRSAAITQFVESPAASHLDVIALLKKLQATIVMRIQKEKQSKERKEDEMKDAAADDAADLLLESIILRVFETDATWFILAYLLSPDVIASAPQRTTATILTRLALWAPADRTVAVLRVLLEPRRRLAIGFFLHKQILRLLFECSDNNQLARDLFLAEWQRRNAAETKMPVDVLHEVVKLCVPVLNGSNEEKQALAWRIAEDLVSDAEKQDIDPATIVSLFVPSWQPVSALGCSRLDEQATSLSLLIRNTEPPRVLTAGVEAPNSFGFFHSQLQAESMSPFRGSTHQMCERMAKLMEKLSRVSKHPFVRVVSQLQQFLFSASMEGLPDAKSIERLHQLLVQATLQAVDAKPAQAASSPAASSPWSGLSVQLDHTTEWCLQVLPRLFAGLSLQVLTRALVTDYHEDQRPHPACATICQQHPYAVRLRETVSTLLTALLQTPPSEAARRQRVAKAVTALMSQVTATVLPPPTGSASRTAPSTTWAIELFQAPLKDLLNCLRQDSQQYANLPPGVDSNV